MPKLSEITGGGTLRLSDLEEGDAQILGEQPTDELAPKELDSAWDFSGERTLGGRIKAGNIALARDFATTGLSAIEGLSAIAEKTPTARISDAVGQKVLDLIGQKERYLENKEKAKSFIPNAINYINEQSALKGDEKYNDLWTTKLGGGAGSLGAFFLATAAGGPAGVATFSIGSGAGTQTQKLRQAKEAGEDISDFEETAALTLGGAIGLLETYTPLKILKAIPKDIPAPARQKIFDTVNNFLKTGAGEVVKTGVGEGSQEVASSILQSLVEMGYNPNAELPTGESLWDDFTIGAVLGGGSQAVRNVVVQNRTNAMSGLEMERERKAREHEDGQNALLRMKLDEMASQRVMEKIDPLSFAEASQRAQSEAFKLPPPSEEEVKQFNAPSAFGAVATPSALGELYALRLIGSLGQNFPSDTSFSVKELPGVEKPITNPDGTQGVEKKPLYAVVDGNGNQYGHTTENPQIASSLESNLNKEVQSKGIRNSILDTLMVSPEGYTPEQTDKLFRYGFRTLSPDSNRVTFAALNDAAGTTTENGYIEDLPLDAVASAKEVRKGRYEVQMPDGTKKYIAGLTASQKLNLKRVNEGLPAVTTFGISEAREALGGDVGRLALPGVSGIQDSLSYGAKVLNGKPIVISEANEVITQRKTTAAEKARAGVDEDGKSVLPDYIEFKTLDEAKRYAGRLNQRTGTSRVMPSEILEGKKGLVGEIKRLLGAKNIVADIGSPEIDQLVQAFTGANTFKEMTADDRKLFYNRVRNLPKFEKLTKIPVFKQRLYTPEQFVRASMWQYSNPVILSQEEVGFAIKMDKTDPNYNAVTQSIVDELNRQNDVIGAENRRFTEEVKPIQEEMQQIMSSFGMSPFMLNLGITLKNREGQNINAEAEGYYDPAFKEIMLAIDAIDPEGKLTQEQRVSALKSVLSHEVLHALRNLDMFTQKEYALLETAVSRTQKPGKDMTYLQWARRPRSQGGYFEDSPTVQVEEAIADMVRDFIVDKRVIGGKPRNLIERIIKFFQKMRNMMDGYGFKTFDEVIAAIESGQIGRRYQSAVTEAEDGTRKFIGPVRSLRASEQMLEKAGRLPARYQKFGDIFEQGPTIVPGQAAQERVPGRVIQEPVTGQAAPVSTDFDPTALEGAEVRMSRLDSGVRYSVKDISGLKDANGRSLKTFAEQFSDKIKQSDRTLSDVDRIAKGFVEEFVNDPAKFLPVVVGKKLSMDEFLRMPDGTMYDPEKLEHADASDQTIAIYNANKDGSIKDELNAQAEKINKNRQKDLSKLSRYLNQNSEYSLAEQALIMKGASNYAVRSKKGGGYTLTTISDNNKIGVSVISSFEAASVVTQLRNGKNLKDAIFDGIVSAINSKKNKNKKDGYSGWKTFKQSGAEKDAAELKDASAGREWCIAGDEGIARDYLSRGDFHIYYENGEPIVALRTIDGRLAEAPRGSLENQFMTEEEEKIAEEALRAGRVSGGEDYLDDRKLIKDVMSGKFKEWDDIELFQKRKRKYAVGYGIEGYEFPKPVIDEINKEISRREPKDGWDSVGIRVGDLNVGNEDVTYDYKVITGNIEGIDSFFLTPYTEQERNFLLSIGTSEQEINESKRIKNPIVNVEYLMGNLTSDLGTFNIGRIDGTVNMGKASSSFSLHTRGILTTGPTVTVSESAKSVSMYIGTLKANKIDGHLTLEGGTAFVKEIESASVAITNEYQKSTLYAKQIGAINLRSGTVYAETIDLLHNGRYAKNPVLNAKLIKSDIAEAGYVNELLGITLNVIDLYGPVGFTGATVRADKVHGTVISRASSNDIVINELVNNNSDVTKVDGYDKSFIDGNLISQGSSLISISKVEGMVFGSSKQKDRPILVNEVGIKTGLGEKIVQEPIVAEMPESFYEGMSKIKEAFPDEASDVRYSRKAVPGTSKYKAFETLAQSQRGSPEIAMVRAQGAISKLEDPSKVGEKYRDYTGSGAYKFLLEHVGDLTHRMSEMPNIQPSLGLGTVSPKIRQSLNILNNAIDIRDMSNIPSIPETVKYSKEHSKLEVFNEMQRLARDSAVAIGNKDFDTARINLQKIADAIADGSYASMAMEYNPDIRYSQKALPDTIDVDGVQRPTRNNEGKYIYSEFDIVLGSRYDGEIQPTEEGIRNFWRWFGDSTTVDEEGRPIVYYHGTKYPGEIDEFKSDTGMYWATPSPEFASTIAIGITPNENVPSVLPVYVRSTNAFKYGNLNDVRALIGQIEKRGYKAFIPGLSEDANRMIGAEEIKEIKKKIMGDYLTHEGLGRKRGKTDDDNWKLYEGIVNDIRALGFDGFHVWESGVDNIASFDKTSLKSALSNVGLYGPDDARIMYSRKDLQGEPKIPFEVAPSPDNKERTAAWRMVPHTDKVRITQSLGPKAVREASKILGIDSAAFEPIISGQGLFEGHVNPNQILGIREQFLTPDEVLEFASVLGRILEQKAMIAADGRMTGRDTSVIRIQTKVSSPKVADRIYAALTAELGDLGGYTAYKNHIDVFNFTNTDSESLGKRFVELLNTSTPDIKFSVSHDTIQSAYLENESYDRYIQRKKSANQERLERGIESARSRIIGELETSIRRTEQRSDGQRRVRRQAPQTGRASDAIGGASRARSLQEVKGPEWLPVPEFTGAETIPAFTQRKVQKDAVSAFAVHYSQMQGLMALDSAFAGSGSAGGERRRFGMGVYGSRVSPGDTARRLYFYVQSKMDLPGKEDVVTGNATYRVRLDNLYDVVKDPLGLKQQAGVNPDLFEELVNDAGYDGAVYPEQPGIEEPTVVLFGLSDKVPVRPYNEPLPEQPVAPISEEQAAEAVAKAENDTQRTGKGAVPLYGKDASPEALYIAQNPETAATLTEEDKVRYSRKNTPIYSPKARQIIDKNTPCPPDETMGKSIIEMMGFPNSRDMWDSFRQAAFFRYGRLERQYRENIEFMTQLADTSAVAAVEMADQSRRFTNEAMRKGVIVYENGMTLIKDFYHNGKKIDGLIGIMAMLHTKEYGNLEELAQAYATAVRGERLNAEGKLTPVSPGELAELKKEVAKFVNPKTGKPVVEEWFNAWQDYNSYTVKFLRDTGILDDAGAELWAKQADYVPFYREDKDGNLVHPRVFGGLHTAGQFKAVGKSDKAINVDMVTAITNNIDTAIAMGMKNVAQQRVIRDQIKLGLAHLVKPGEQVGKRASVSFKVSGKRYTAIIEDPLIYESMLPVSEYDLSNILGKILTAPANFFREIIIRDPGYQIANMFRDTLSAYVITGANIVPIVDTVRNIAADISQLEKLGVVGSNYDLNLDRNGVRDFYEKHMRQTQANAYWHKPWLAVWDGLGRLSERSEAATRMAVYNDVLKRTGNMAEAQYQALSVMNYGRRGGNRMMRLATAVIPFLNARMQGLDKLYQAFRGRVGAKYDIGPSGGVQRTASQQKNYQRFAARAAIITAMTVLYYSMIEDDDEYLTASPEIRDNYYIIPLLKGDVGSGEPGLSMKLPIPFEIGILFKVIPERLLAMGKGEDTPRDFAQSMTRQLKSTLGVNLPQAMLPLYEAYVSNNDSFTGRPVIPTYMENLLPEQQQSFYTNQAIAKAAEAVGMSPMKAEHVISGYMPGVGAYFLQALDSTVREFQGPEMAKPALQWFQYPVVKRFFTTANQPGLQNQFYDLKDQVDGITQTMNKLEEQGRYEELAVFYAKNGHKFDMRSDLNALERQIGRLRDERKVIEQMPIDPEDKRELIEQLNMQINASLLTVPMYRQEAFGKGDRE